MNALPEGVCMWFNDDTLEACGDRASGVARIEVPLRQLTAVDLREIVRQRAAETERRTTFWRRTGTRAVAPNEAGCYLVIDLWLCAQHRARVVRGY